MQHFWHPVSSVLFQRAFLALMLAWLIPMQQANAWELQSQSADPVQLWTEDNPAKPYRLVRADIQINAPILPLLALLQDAAAQPHWLPFAQQVDILSHPAPHQTLVRFQSRSRWPFAARDAVTLFVVTQPDANSVQIQMRNQPDAAPRVKGIQRIRQAEGYWLLTALPNCITQVRYEAGSRWEGRIPQWLVNKLNLGISRDALLNLQQWASHNWQEYPVPVDLKSVQRHADCP